MVCTRFVIAWPIFTEATLNLTATLRRIFALLLGHVGIRAEAAHRDAAELVFGANSILRATRTPRIRQRMYPRRLSNRARTSRVVVMILNKERPQTFAPCRSAASVATPRTG